MKKPITPSPPRTELEHICALTGTEPGDWQRVMRGTMKWTQGYRWRNIRTGQHAKKVINEEQIPADEAGEV